MDTLRRLSPSAFPSWKIAQPRVGAHVRREALLRRLSDIIARAPVCWLTGLPGAGKTSLVARWLQDTGGPCFWYRLDETDADPASFFAALGAQHGGGLTLPVWSPEHGADLGDFTRRFFAELGARPLTLVLDDCHRVRDDGALLSVLAGLHEVAGALKVVVVSRRAPPPALARGQPLGWLGLVDELRLSPEEAQAIATALRGQPLSGEETAALAQADGWLAQVLASTHARQSVRGSNDQVGEFLAEELLQSLPAPTRVAFRRLAELPEVPRNLRDDVLLPPEVAGLLTSLCAQRYFVDESGPQRWRLHDLLRDALLARNTREDDRPSLALARQALAGWVAPELPEAAMALRALAGDAPGALELLERHGAAWLSGGLHQTVSGWLVHLQSDVPHQRGALALWRAQALLPVEPERARPQFTLARTLALETRDAARAYTAWCGEVSSYVVQWGAVAGLAELVDELEALRQALGPPPGDLDFRTAADALTALMYGRPEDPRLADYAERTAHAVAHAPDAGARISAAAQLLVYRLWWAGDFPGGRVLYDAFDAEVGRDEHLAALPRLLWWSCAAIVDWQCGEAKACYEKVERGLALADASGVHVRDFFLLTQGIFCALSQEDWSRAERYLERLARTERTHKRLDAMVHHFFRSWYALCRGEPRAALAHAQTAWPLAEALGSTFHKVIVLSALTPARVAVGDLAAAETSYRQQLALAKASKNPTFSFISFCGGAELAMARGDEAALTKQVERMLMVKALGGFHSHCGWRSPMMAQVLSHAFRHALHPEIAAQWVRQKQLVAPDDAPAAWPRPVRIRARHGLEVEVDGETPEATGVKSAQKLRELLSALVAQRQGVTQADLIDWLWPDADGDRGAASLKTAVHRLRQWLGAEAVRVQAQVVRLNPAVVACDVWALERGTAGHARVLYGFDSPPVLALRERLRG